MSFFEEGSEDVCRTHDAEDIDPRPLYHKLKGKKDKVRWNEQNREEEFVLFAKSFESRPSKDELPYIEPKAFS